VHISQKIKVENNIKGEASKQEDKGYVPLSLESLDQVKGSTYTGLQGCPNFEEWMIDNIDWWQQTTHFA